MNLDRRLASRIIHSLGESGQPPKLGALHLNVGTEPLIQRLRGDYFEDLLMQYEGQDGLGACKWVEANYGNGKTQFLRCIQEVAWDLNYVTAYVELSQDECPLDRSDRVYGAVARSVQAKPIQASDVDVTRGIDVALEQLIDRMFPQVLSGFPDDQLKAQCLDWIRTTLASTPTESTGFRDGAVQHLISKVRGDADKAKTTATYLRGEPLPASELKSVGLYEKLDKSNGFRFLRSMCQLIQRSGLAAGTTLLFDEARRSLSLMSTKGQKVACENLLSVINKCNEGELPGTIFLYAVMPEFFTDFATAYPALQQRCGPSTRIKLEDLLINEEKLLSKIGERITELFRLAYVEPLGEPADLTRNLQLIAAESLKVTMGSGSRRLLVKSWVGALKYFRENGFRLFSPQDAEACVAGARIDLDAVEKAAVAGQGE